ncbi:MAG TPA: PD-(D/E)XK nuclease family transposase [Pirellulales bacterium]|nr:PD-(D/E)XK nuclease family transposase [Pirellulales bacterium]
MRSEGFRKTVEELATPLDRWLYFLRHAQEIDSDALPDCLDVPEVRRALGDLVMITQSELDRERYESRLKAQLDANSILAEARKAREKGLAEGRAEGRAEGQISRIQSFQRLLRQPVTDSGRLQTLSFTELESLATRLEAELSQKFGNGS